MDAIVVFMTVGAVGSLTALAGALTINYYVEKVRIEMSQPSTFRIPYCDDETAINTGGGSWPRSSPSARFSRLH